MTDHAPTHGAFHRNGQTRFALWAPDAARVSLEIDDTASHPLTPDRDGWFSLTLPCPPGTRYRYVIHREEGDLPVPDPASRCQPDDVHGFSQVTDLTAYDWQHPGWSGRPWHEAIIYELHVGLLGGFDGVRTRLRELQKLGITAIELMPLAEYPGARNWGYDGVLPFAPDSSCGSPAQLQALIDEAHALGLMVYVDVVYNHFGPDGNYIGQYAGSFFREDIQTPWGAAIDFRRREVRDFFCENALMWVLDYRIDGLRFDAVHAISERDFLTELAARVRARVREVDSDRHVHLMLENEDNCAALLEQGFDAQWNDDWHNVMHFLLTDEREGYYADFSEDATGKLARCLREGFIYQGEHDRRGECRGEPSAHLSPTSFIQFLQNHDQVGNRAFGERLRSLADEDALKCAVVLQLLSPAIPLLFMGEEWGSRQPFLYFTDHNEELARAVFEGRQQEFAEFTHFSASGRTVPDPNSFETFETSRPDFGSADMPEPHAWQHFYSELLSLRHQKIVPRLQGARAERVEILGDRALMMVWLMNDGCSLRMDINFGSSEVCCPETFSAEHTLFAFRSDGSDGVLPPSSIRVMLSESA